MNALCPRAAAAILASAITDTINPDRTQQDR
jgi:hypothetical protein